MRLIDVNTIELEFFTDNNVPEYAILSHTWGPDEITYQEFTWITRLRALSGSFETQSVSTISSETQDEQSVLMLAAMEMMIRGNWNPGTSLASTPEEDLTTRHGYSKIIESAREAKNLGYKYIWIDTCCIDKSSSAELQEAINSMYRWYKNSAVCLVYLADIQPLNLGTSRFQTAPDMATKAFTTSRWTTRGWTLQELVAPCAVRFYLQNWSFLGEKHEFLEELSSATGIPAFVLEDGDPSEVSAAERMSWACRRETTRIEDLAYCLLGLFDIQMPLLYGEGDKAFIRLQEEILRTTDDYSLFAWRATTNDRSIYRGLLARSPAEFQDCGTIEREDVASTSFVSSTPIGLNLQLELLPDPLDATRFLAMIRSSNDLNQRLAIYLKCLDGHQQYARVDAGSVMPIDDWPTAQLRNIFVRQKLSIPAEFSAPEMRCFHIRRRLAGRNIPPVRIVHAFPPELWNQEEHKLDIPENTTDCFGVLLLRVQSPTYAHSLNFPVIFGFNRATCHYWCKVVETELLGTIESRRGWQARLKKMLPPELFDPRNRSAVHHDILVVGDSALGLNVSMRAGLCGDSIALHVLIDGLVEWR